MNPTVPRALSMQAAAGLLGIGPRQLTAFLREQGVLHSQGPMRNSPKGYFIREGYMDCKLVQYHTGDVRHLYNKPLVTSRGLVLIQELIQTHGMAAKEPVAPREPNRPQSEQNDNPARAEVLRLAGIEKT